MSGFSELDYIELYDAYVAELDDEYGSESALATEIESYFNSNGGAASPWILDRMSETGTAAQLYLPDVVDTANTVVNDFMITLGGAGAYDLSKMLSTKNMAEIVDDFGAAATANNPPLTAQAQSAFSDFSRAASKWALKGAVVGVASQVALEALDQDWVGVAHDMAGFGITFQAAKIGQVGMEGFAKALADGLYGPVSGSKLSFFGSKFVQASGGLLFAGSAYFAFDQAWKLAEQLHSGQLQSDYSWFLGKVLEYGENYLDDLFDGLVDPQDFADAIKPYLDKWVPEAPRFGLPGWLDGPLPLFGGAKDIVSPLVLDLDGDGVELTTFSAATTTTFFDIDGDGFAEQTAWVSSDDGFLVRDVNENGSIDDVTELFGSPTVDGFAKLALLDSNGDLIINQYDDAWDELLIWQDVNGDATSQAEELVTLASLDIVSIDLAGVTASTTTISGNPISHTSTFRYENNTTAAIVDAWFVHDNVNTTYAADYTLDVDAIFLPTLRGFGEVAALHIAMSVNEDLLDLVADLTTGWGFDAWEDPSALDNAVSEILYEWAGVTDSSPSVYGGVLDSRSLAFMEVYFAQAWSQTQVTPQLQQSATLHAAWLSIFGHLKAAILVQSGAHSLFASNVTYDLYAGEVSGTMSLSSSAIASLTAFADNATDTEAYWIAVAEFLEFTAGLDNLSTDENTWLGDAVAASSSLLTWTELAYLAVNGLEPESIYGTNVGETITGDNGADHVYADGGNDTIYAEGGNDIVEGHGGDDTIYGGTGNDELDGGVGSDTLYGEGGSDHLVGGDDADLLDSGTGDDIAIGGNGNDTYVYTSGNDWYSEWAGAGTDVILMPTGITSADISLARINQDNLLISVDGLGTIEVNEFFYGTTFRIETIQFSNSTTLDLTAISEISVLGTDGDDFIDGSNYVEDTMYGFAGNDRLRGFTGDDILDGGSGNDVLQGAAGADRYIFSPGFDTINESGTDIDTLVIPVGYTINDLTFTKSGVDLLVFAAGLGQVEIDKFFQSSSYRVEEIYLEESSSSVLFSSLSIEQRGGDGNDNLSGISSGVSANDVLNGMAGNDTLQGLLGDDTYVFSVGQDIFIDTGGTDTIVFWEDWLPENITMYRQSAYGTGSNADDLVVVDHLGNKTIVPDFFDISSRLIEYAEFSDTTVWDLGAISYETWGTSGNNVLDNSDSSNGVFRPYAGNDIIYGRGGDDIVYYTSGLDTVSDTGGTDTLHIENYTVSDVSISNYSTYHIKLVFSSGVDEITMNYFRQSATNEVEIIRFEDGFQADLPSYASWQWGTTSGETLNGTSGADTIVGKAGTDTVNAGAGADAVHGGADADTLYGGDGDDLLHGGTGDDALYGEDGLDTLLGGSGADTFALEAASAFNDVDVISDFSEGDGDIIDISDILDGYYTFGTDVLTDFVLITDVGTDSTLAIDQDGTANGSNFTAVATLLGVTGLTNESALETSGALVTH
ncbi:calcium-binding protein [Seohaeicola zhoushanensis]|uniref:Haemolysin-type calcium binding-related domain-containing protein n=1 Tax=Seohaeicola zhoushanensis TaxID=1569283 RepID=A0A8J3H2U8_9RHOB|nr:calcium-binding protein [Seohaeicola zhoushanensis]GHF70019.1 hypothetical protein GCM10017056_46340 [Seohaeicola zhoushanensis]